MTAKDTARRLVAAHGREGARYKVWRRRQHLSAEEFAARAKTERHDRACVRLTFWRAVASALAREAM